MRKWLLILMALMLSLTLAACGSSESMADKLGTELVQDAQAELEANKQDVADEAIVGSWSADGTTFTFNADGTGNTVFSIVGENDAGNDFFYTAEDGKLTMTSKKETVETTYTISGDKLTLKNDTGTGVYTRVK